MTVISDGVNSYTDRDGNKVLINPESASAKIGDDYVFRFEGTAGLLELSMNQLDIGLLVKTYGGLPIAQMQVPGPFELTIVQNVREIRPLAKKDGTFLMAVAVEKPAPRGLLRRIFG